MFGFLKRKPAPKPLEIRDTLFGDRPLTQFLRIGPEALAGEPWASFGRVRAFMDAYNSKAATATLFEILSMPRLESRMALQAWHILRELGEQPPVELEKQVLGVVVEVGLPQGLDLVAGYADHRARYFNLSGAGVVWECPSNALDEAIDNLLKVGSLVVRTIGPWRDARPPAPVNGNARLNMLTPSGIHFGEGPMDALSNDTAAGAILGSALRLMQLLIEMNRAAPAN